MTSREMREWRKTLGLTQQEAASALGVGARTVRAWEGGEWPIPTTVAFACQWLQAGSLTVRKHDNG
jgi:DNA-binding transcriptional regulator YiaG